MREVDDRELHTGELENVYSDPCRYPLKQHRGARNILELRFEKGDNRLVVPNHLHILFFHLVLYVLGFRGVEEDVAIWDALWENTMRRNWDVLDGGNTSLAR